MTGVWRFLFWANVGCLFYIYIGYPFCLWTLGLFAKFDGATNEKFLPRVSVLISARNEEQDIEWKVRETLAWHYPTDRLEVLVASDASGDRTDEILRSIPDSRLKYIRIEQRVGKNEALNRLAKLANGDLLFFTDANSRIAPEFLGRMTRHFADSRVACVTGMERTVEGFDEGAVGYGNSAYLSYESLIDRLESRLGSVLVCDGSAFCIRRELFATLDPDLANDLELPIKIGRRGFAVVYEPLVWSLEKNTFSLQEELRRRRRICGQGFLGMWRLRKQLRGVRAWQFLSRKLLRWITLVPLLLVVITSAILSSQPMYRGLLFLEGIFCGLAMIGFALVCFGKKSNRLLSIPLYFLLANTAAMLGVLDTCFGRRYRIWEIPTLSRGTMVNQRPAAASRE